MFGTSEARILFRAIDETRDVTRRIIDQIKGVEREGEAAAKSGALAWAGYARALVSVPVAMAAIGTGAVVAMARVEEAYRDSLVHDERFRTSLRATRLEQKINIDHMKAFASEMEGAWHVQDEAILDSMGTLLRAGATTEDQVKRMTTLAANLAAAEGGTVQSVSQEIYSASRRARSAIMFLEQRTGDLSKAEERRIERLLKHGNRAAVLDIILTKLGHTYDDEAVKIADLKGEYDEFWTTTLPKFGEALGKVSSQTGIVEGIFGSLNKSINFWSNTLDGVDLSKWQGIADIAIDIATSNPATPINDLAFALGRAVWNNTAFTQFWKEFTSFDGKSGAETAIEGLVNQLDKLWELYQRDWKKPDIFAAPPAPPPPPAPAPPPTFPSTAPRNIMRDRGLFGSGVLPFALPARQAGGHVGAGMAHVVGEMGREIFVPDQSGRIIPSHHIQDATDQGSRSSGFLLQAGVSTRMFAASVSDANRSLAEFSGTLDRIVRLIDLSGIDLSSRRFGRGRSSEDGAGDAGVAGVSPPSGGGEATGRPATPGGMGAGGSGWAGAPPAMPGAPPGGAGVGGPGQQLAGVPGTSPGAAGPDLSPLVNRGSANFMKGQYGDVGENLTDIVTASGRKIQVNAAAAPYFKGFLDDLEASGYKIDSLGGFSPRNKVGGRGLSQHAYGNAIDINPDQNPFQNPMMGGRGMRTNMPENISDIAARHGLSWGGDWKTRKDPMHFEWTGATSKDLSTMPGVPGTRMSGVSSKPVSPSDAFPGIDVRNLPAGMRNNNPGNIKFVGQNVPGIVGPSVNTDQGDPQAVFDSPQSGMAAMASLALKKYKSGKVTLNQLIAGHGGWTPGNFQSASNIARTMGIKPTDDLNLVDPGKMQLFARGLMTQEHGPKSALYTDALIKAGISQAMDQPLRNPLSTVSLADRRNPLEEAMRQQRELQIGRGRVDVMVKAAKDTEIINPRTTSTPNLDVGLGVDNTGSIDIARIGDPSFRYRSGAR